MRRLHDWINRIIRRRRGKPEDIPRKLDAEALQRAMEEARFLHGGHAVEVRALEPGETPGLPKRVD